MARLPDKTALSGPASLRSGRTIASIDESGIGRGIAQAGAGLQSLSGDLTDIAVQNRRDGIVLEGAHSDGGSTKDLYDFKRQFDTDTDYATFGPRFEAGAKAIRDKWAAQISDPKARQLWAAGFDNRVQSTRDGIIELGNRRIREGKLVDYKTGLEGFQSVIADADVPEAERATAKANANAWVDAAAQQGLLTPSEADEWRQKVIEGGEFVLGQRILQREGSAAISGKLPATVSGRASSAMSYFTSRGWTKEQAAGIVGNLIGESSLDTGARNRGDGNDGSDSIGIGQWNAGRARALKDFAALNHADWRDFEIQLAFVDHELRTSESSAGNALKNAKNVDDATAAFIGYERPKGWSAANPRGGHNYSGRLKFAAQAAGETIKPDWYLNQSPDNQLRLENMGAATDADAARAAAAQDKAIREAANDDYRLRIATGDAGLLPGDILGDTRLDNGQKATLINSYNEKYEENIRTGLDLEALQGGSLNLNPFDSDDQKRADNLHDSLMKSIEGNPNPQIEPEAARQYVTESIVRAGVVPKGVMDMLRAGVQSTNTADVVGALQQAQRISQINPAALGRRDGGAAVQDAVNDFSHYVNGLNLSPEDAARRIMDARDPEKQRTRKTLEPLAKDFIKAAAETDIADIFDEGIFSPDPALGFNRQQEEGIKADFLAIAEDQFYRANGDSDLALNRAQEQFKQLYGSTSLTGRPVVMKHPPEHYWPKFGISRAGNTDYVSGEPSLDYAVTQLRKDLSELYPNPDMSKVQLFTLPETDAMVKRGEPPAYAVIYTDENGVDQTLPGKLWLPDFKAAQDRVAPFDEKAKQERIDSARRQQGFIRDVMPEVMEEAERFRSNTQTVFPLEPGMGAPAAEPEQPVPPPDMGAMP